MPCCLSAALPPRTLPQQADRVAARATATAAPARHRSNTGSASLAVGHGRTRHRERMLAKGAQLGHRTAAAAPAELYEPRVRLVQLAGSQLRRAWSAGPSTLQTQVREAATPEATTLGAREAATLCR